MRLSRRPLPPRPPVEIVERKGRGHPDTVCDAVAEAVSRALCRRYLDRVGRILHHNVDKVLLRGGAARARFGGGERLAPVEIYVAGRASGEGLEALVEAAAREAVAAHIPGLPPEGLVVRSLLRGGSTDLVGLFDRGARCNDTSCGVGWAPLSPVEAAVLAVEHGLTDPAWRPPWLGTDVKLMAVAEGGRVELTVAAAMVAGAIPDRASYDAAKAAVAARAHALAELDRVVVNVGDGEEVYLTLSGSSAEAGDDGEVGRGNRCNGLICPMRPATMEAAAGKNPATHVGKLYHLVAGRVAEGLVADGAAEAEVWLVSRIGAPVAEPWFADVALRGEADVEAVLRRELGRIDELTAALVRGEIAVY